MPGDSSDAAQTPGEGSDSAAVEQALSAASAAADQAASKPYIIFLAPQGRRFDDACACELAKQDRLLFICGHYEGIDERAYTLADEVISLGDYVLTSGELASMVVIDAVVRKLPGVLGAETGALGESFADGLLEYPAVHAPCQLQRHGGAGGSAVAATTARSTDGAASKASSAPAACAPTLLEGMELPDADRAFLQSLSTEAAAVAAARYHRQLSACGAPLARAL